MMYLWCLEEEGDEGLNLQDLCGLLHEDVVILEAEADQLASLQGSVGAGHGYDLNISYR